jgi:outer membrane lipoprotein-sorting protein
MSRLFWALTLFAAGVTGSDTVHTILARMDQAAPQLHTLTADVAMDTYTTILDDHTIEHGKLTLERSGKQLRAILDFSSQSDPRVIAVIGKIVQIYYPNLKLVQEYNFGNQTNLLNQYLLLGFGSSGTELAQNYSISGGSTADIAGRQTAEIILIPKDPQVKQHLKEVDMWIPNDAAYPIQQKFIQPNGDYRQTTYTNVRLNPPIQEPLALKLPPGVKHQNGNQ